MPLGMEDGSIANDQITTDSHAYDFYAWKARLNNADGHWLSTSQAPWIQVAFQSEVNITALQIQRGYCGACYLTQVQVQTGDSEDTLSYIKDGNKTAVSFTLSLNEEKTFTVLPYINMNCIHIKSLIML